MLCFPMFQPKELPNSDNLTKGSYVHETQKTCQCALHSTEERREQRLSAKFTQEAAICPERREGFDRSNILASSGTSFNQTVISVELGNLFSKSLDMHLTSSQSSM